MDHSSNLPGSSGGLPGQRAAFPVFERVLRPAVPRFAHRSFSGTVSRRTFREFGDGLANSRRSGIEHRGRPHVQRPIPVRFQGRGRLDASDALDRNAAKRYYVDDWLLPRGIKAGQLVEVTLRSRQFDAYLYLADARSRRGVPILTGLDTLFADGSERFSSDARLVFSVQPKRQYRLRVSSQIPRAQGRYTLSFRVYPAPPSPFNFFYGSGLVDAAAAVASALGSSSAFTTPLLSPDDWGRSLVQAAAVWFQAITGKGVTVAVLDTGVDRSHPDLQPNAWLNSQEITSNGIDDDQNGLIDDVGGWDFVDDDNDPSDGDGHGTHVAGLVAAARNGSGITGVAPDARILPIRVLSRKTNPGDPTGNIALIRGIDYAVQMGAQVINLSLSKGYGYTLELDAALQRANQAGAVVVIASGNDRESGGRVQPSPLAQRAMTSGLGITVGAVDRTQAMALFSNPAGRIPGQFVVAPGVEVLSTLPAGQFGLLDGTSMAAPHVSGIAALMLSAKPELTPAQVYAILTQTASPQKITVTP